MPVISSLPLVDQRTDPLKSCSTICSIKKLTVHEVGRCSQPNEIVAVRYNIGRYLVGTATFTGVLDGTRIWIFPSAINLDVTVGTTYIGT